MPRIARSYVAFSTVGALLLSAEAAHASCEIPIADYQDGGGGKDKMDPFFLPDVGVTA